MASTDAGLAIKETHTLVAESERLPDNVQKVVLTGDLGKLNDQDRALYYLHVCKSVGVNPATRPFEFTVLNGKTVLYAKRDCTDQLRALKCVSVNIVSRERIDELYAVTARASLPDGRVDESIGVVTLSNVRGDAAANLLMKAETKAKRRVTLSICGLGFTDESELETIPGSRSEPDSSQWDVPRKSVANSAPEVRPGEPIQPTSEQLRKKLAAAIVKWSGLTDKADRMQAMWSVFDSVGVARPSKSGDTPDDDLNRLIAWVEDRVDKGVEFFQAVAAKHDADPQVKPDKKSPEVPPEPPARKAWPKVAKPGTEHVWYWILKLIENAEAWKKTVKKKDHLNTAAKDMVAVFEQQEKLPQPGSMPEDQAALRYKAAAESTIEWDRYLIPF